MFFENLNEAIKTFILEPHLIKVFEGARKIARTFIEAANENNEIRNIASAACISSHYDLVFACLGYHDLADALFEDLVTGLSDKLWQPPADIRRKMDRVKRQIYTCDTKYWDYRMWVWSPEDIRG